MPLVPTCALCAGSTCFRPQGPLDYAESGVGFRIKEATSFFNTASVFAGLLVLMVISLILLGGLKLIESRVLRWQTASDTLSVEGTT